MPAPVAILPVSLAQFSVAVVVTVAVDSMVWLRASGRSLTSNTNPVSTQTITSTQANPGRTKIWSPDWGNLNFPNYLTKFGSRTPQAAHLLCRSCIAAQCCGHAPFSRLEFTHLMLDVPLVRLRSNGLNSAYLNHFQRTLYSNLTGNLGLAVLKSNIYPMICTVLGRLKCGFCFHQIWPG